MQRRNAARRPLGNDLGSAQRASEDHASRGERATPAHEGQDERCRAVMSLLFASPQFTEVYPPSLDLARYPDNNSWRTGEADGIRHPQPSHMVH